MKCVFGYSDVASKKINLITYLKLWVIDIMKGTF